MSRLEVKRLVKTLGARGGASAVLRDVTFHAADGECLGLKGSTGSGKSTLLRIVAGLLAPDAGEVELDSVVISSPKVMLPPARRGIGFVFQNLGLWPHLTVRGHLEYALSAAPYSRTECERLRAETVSTFVLSGLEDRYPAELSGGERHLLALARAMCTDIRLLLLDEPFTGLDGTLKERVLATLRRERLRRNLTTVLVTHDDAEMRLLCQRVIHLDEGHIVERVASERRKQY